MNSAERKVSNRDQILIRSKVFFVCVCVGGGVDVTEFKEQMWQGIVWYTFELAEWSSWNFVCNALSVISGLPTFVLLIYYHRWQFIDSCGGSNASTTWCRAVRFCEVTSLKNVQLVFMLFVYRVWNNWLCDSVYQKVVNHCIRFCEIWCGMYQWILYDNFSGG